jgi:hypothetical protein
MKPPQVQAQFVNPLKNVLAIPANNGISKGIDLSYLCLYDYSNDLLI